MIVDILRGAFFAMVVLCNQGVDVSSSYRKASIDEDRNVIKDEGPVKPPD